MIHRATLSAPANLLLAGEYAITREGGLGIGLAVAPRGEVRIYADEPESGAQRLTVAAIMERAGPTLWPDTPLPIVNSVLAVLAHSGEGPVSDKSGPDETQWHLELDTSSFFDPATGRKRGLGSSAVATLLLAAALRWIAGAAAEEVTGPDTARLAITAHRAAHGGRGSGYDIATSATGGAILFTGGTVPQWAPTPIVDRFHRSDVLLNTWAGRTPVSSSRAIELFDRNIPKGSDRAEEFIGRSNDAVREIAAASGWEELFSAIARSAREGVALGEEIGVSAELPFVGCHSADGWLAKASGAGNERGVVIARSDHRRPFPDRTESIAPDREGLRWEYQRR